MMIKVIFFVTCRIWHQQWSHTVVISSMATVWESGFMCKRRAPCAMPPSNPPRLIRRLQQAKLHRPTKTPLHQSNSLLLRPVRRKSRDHRETMFALQRRIVMSLKGNTPTARGIVARRVSNTCTTEQMVIPKVWQILYPAALRMGTQKWLLRSLGKRTET